MPSARYLNNPEKLVDGVFLVGGPELSDERDCLCYLVVGQSARVLIDCGAGPSARRILDLAERAGGGPPSHLLLTHAHIDHAGGAAELKSLTGCRVLIHQAEAEVLESGDVERSAAAWYGLGLDPVAVDQILTGDGSIPLGGGEELHLIHTPGHTPGSLAAWCQRGSEKILFGQDIHGPFLPVFGSNLDQWARSMRRLLELEADVLAEGHYGVFRPAARVRAFIEGHLAAQGLLTAPER